MVDPAVVFLTWKCPRRAAGSRQLKHIPVDIFDEIFSWLHPINDPDMGENLHHRTMALLAPVCRYFAYYAAREVARSLDFDGDGGAFRVRTPTATWCIGIIRSRQPMETFRKNIRECAIHHWIPDPSILLVFEKLLKLFPRVLTRLESLSIVKLSMIPISQALFNSISRLHTLTNLHIHGCYLQGVIDAPPQTTIENAFPVLRHLVLAECHAVSAESPIADLFTILVRAPTLRSLTLVDSWWFPIMYPHLPSRLLSLCVNLSRRCISDFVTYLKTCNALEHLTIFSQEYDVFVSTDRGPVPVYNHYELTTTDCENFKLERGDLQNLRSFSGPLWLASIFVPGRPVSRVALGCHLSKTDEVTPLPVQHGLGVFESSHPRTGALSYSDVQGNVEFVLRSIVKESVGDGIQALSVPIREGTELGVIAAQLPDLVHLQLQFICDENLDVYMSPDHQHQVLTSLRVGLQGFRHLKLLYVCLKAAPELELVYQLSPGHQYDFVREWKRRCITLTTVAFGSYMVWHWRRSASVPMPIPSQSRETKNLTPAPTSHATTGSKPKSPSKYTFQYQWEIEILSSHAVRRGLKERLWLEKPELVRDWRGILKGLFPPPERQQLEYIFLR